MMDQDVEEAHWPHGLAVGPYSTYLAPHHDRGRVFVRKPAVIACHDEDDLGTGEVADQEVELILRVGCLPRLARKQVSCFWLSGGLCLVVL